MYNHEYKPSLNLTFMHGDDIDPRVRTDCNTAVARTRFNSKGVLERVPANTPRIAYNPNTGSPLGLMSEQLRVNSCTNGEVLGATTGVVGSGGSLATGMSLTSDAGLTTTVTGTTLDNKNVNVVGITIQGTPTSSLYSLKLEGLATAVAGNRYTGSLMARVPSGTKTGVVYEQVRIESYTSIGVMTSVVSTTVSQSLDALYRFPWAKIGVPTGSERVTHSFEVGVSVGTPVSVTYNIGMIQLERGGIPTSYIPTSIGTATRPDEVNYIKNIPNLFGKDKGTLTVEFNPSPVDSAFNTSPTMATYTNAGVTDYFRFALSLSESRPSLSVVKGGATSLTQLSYQPVRTSVANRTAFSWDGTKAYAISDAVVSSYSVTLTGITYPSLASVLYIGTRQSSVSANINGAISQLQTYPVYIEPGEISLYLKSGSQAKADYSDL